MSDTVKLIIEIDKRAYKACQELRTNNDDGIVGLCAVNAIADGTPLEEVKVEIKSSINSDDADGYSDYRAGLRQAIKIIDKYTAESEKK